jgi:trk system potassium uptake protein TrkH
MVAKNIFRLSPVQVIIATMLATILMGTFLLALPMARLQPMSFVDLFFTAASSTCLAGFFTVPLSAFTMFGKIIIMILLQVGALGLTTMMLFFLSLFMDLNLATQLMAGQLLELESWKDVRKIITFIIAFITGAELIGAFFLYWILHNPLLTFGQNVFNALFYAVSFCTTAGAALDTDMTHFQHNFPMLAVSAILFLVGGLGFITWYELICYSIARVQKKRYKISLSSKIIIFGEFVLIGIGWGLFWALEYNHSLKSLGFFTGGINALFNTIASLGSGVLTVDPLTVFPATWLLIIFIALVGTTPSSPGGGIRITTFVVFLATVRAAVTHRSAVEIRGRQIPEDQVYIMVAIIFLALTCIGLSTFCLMITESGIGFLPLFLEAASSFATLGLSLDTTSELSSIGKFILIFNMIIGRIGSVMIILALKKKETEFSYPEERVMFT